MKRNYVTLLTTILISFFISLTNVFAEIKVIERQPIKIDGQTVYKMYSNTEMGEIDIVRSSGAIIKISIDGVEYDGFCVDFGVDIPTGINGESLNIHDYYRNVLSEEETNELIKKLTLYTKFGYGTANRKTGKYYLATQQLIWEAINDTGFFNSDFYKQRSGYKFNLVNIGWTTNSETKERIDVSAEMKEIKNAINQYYIKPSFCSNQNKIEIEIGETVEYTDYNNVLSVYDVHCEDGLTCEKNNNKLTVTANDIAGNKRITFSKSEKGSESVIYRAKEGQGIIINQGQLEPISCEFGLNTFQNEKTADFKIIYILVIGAFCVTMAYMAYGYKKSFNK